MNDINHKLLKTYSHFPTWRLFRLKSFFLICRFPFLVNNLNKIYSVSSKILSSRFVNKFIKRFYGDIFVGGENTTELERTMKFLKQNDLIAIADYAKEFLSKEEEKNEMDNIIKYFQEVISSAVKIDSKNSIAIKISSFGNYETLRMLNECQLVLFTIESGIINGESPQEIIKELGKARLKHNLEVGDIDKLRDIIYSDNLPHFKLNLFEIFLDLDNNNSDHIKFLRGILNINPKKYKIFTEFINNVNTRLLKIFSFAYDNKCHVMVDAEQSYLRYISDYIVAYYFKQFNIERCTISNTLQCYLKSQPYHIKKWSEFCIGNNLKFGLKVVRGAYMTEEAKVASSKQIENPVCLSFEQSNRNYDSSIEFLFKTYRQGDKFCFATHNEDSIKLIGKLTEKYSENSENNIDNMEKDIICAQLMGIAEHTSRLTKELVSCLFTILLYFFQIFIYSYL